jgi:hypothetical protein
MKKSLMLCAIFILASSAMSGQEISEKKDLTIFGLNYAGAPPARPAEEVSISATIGKVNVEIEYSANRNSEADRVFQQAIASADSEIRRVFQELGRFNIISMPQKVAEDSTQSFIDALREYREERMEIPPEVRLGREAFTEADLRQIANSFIIVIPKVIFYQLEPDDDGNWEAEIVTNFSITDVENYRSIADFSVESTGYDDNPADAMSSAVGGIADQLSYEIRSIEEFKLRTAILERSGNSLILEFGRNMGIVPGDEFEVTRLMFFAGQAVPRRIGLLRIREVEDRYSVASVIYENERMVPGDQLTEIPRMGLDLVPYVSGVWDISVNGLSSLAAGVKFAPNRGFYAFRPVAGIEVLLSGSSISGDTLGLPVSALFGAEYNLFLGRLRLIPQALIGLIVQIPFDENEDWVFKGIKTSAMVGISYLVPSADDGAEIYLEGGYELQFGLDRGGMTRGVLVTLGGRFR